MIGYLQLENLPSGRRLAGKKVMAKPKENTPPQGEQTDAKALGKALWAVLQATIDAQIGGNKDHGWGAKDSLAVIENIVAEDAALSKCGDVVKYSLSDEAMRMIAEVINPSAFRQQLEKAKRLNKSENVRKAGLDALGEEFGS